MASGWSSASLAFSTWKVAHCTTRISRLISCRFRARVFRIASRWHSRQLRCPGRTVPFPQRHRPRRRISRVFQRGLATESNPGPRGTLFRVELTGHLPKELCPLSRELSRNWDVPIFVPNFAAQPRGRTAFRQMSESDVCCVFPRENATDHRDDCEREERVQRVPRGFQVRCLQPLSHSSVERWQFTVTGARKANPAGFTAGCRAFPPWDAARHLGGPFIRVPQRGLAIPRADCYIVAMRRPSITHAKGRRFPVSGMTLVEVVVCSAVLALSVATLMFGFVKGQEAAKYQSAYQVAVSYAEQGLEYALYTPYTDFMVTNDSTTPMRYVSTLPTATTPALFYSRISSTNIFATTRGGKPLTITNINRLATETNLPLDDLGSYVTDRFVLVRKPSGADTNLDYMVLLVSNRWNFLGRTQQPIVLTTIRNNPSILQ